MQSFRERFEQVAGPAPHAPLSRVPFHVHFQVRDSGLLRRHLTFEPEPGDRVPAWLLLPEALRQPRPASRQPSPAVLCLHQTTKIGKDEPAGLGGKPNLHYARELTLRGYVTLCPDYPNFGQYPYDAYANGYQSTTRKGIVNHHAAVSLLQQLPLVDPRRIAVCGHSLGGHNALFAAAFDPRLRAAITSCGFTSFAKYMRGDLTGWSHAGYMPRIASVFAKDPQRMPWDFADLLRSLAPRPVFVNAPLHDANFDASGVDDAVAASAHPRLTVRHPDAAHDFPAAIRQEAWAWLDRVLS
jgi:dienelactone hydrolase